MYDTAHRLSQSHATENVKEAYIFRESRMVTEALRCHDCTEGLGWCTENKHLLQEVSSKLEFRLRFPGVWSSRNSTSSRKPSCLFEITCQITVTWRDCFTFIASWTLPSSRPSQPVNPRNTCIASMNWYIWIQRSSLTTMACAACCARAPSNC